MRDTIDMAREAGWWTLSCILRVRLKRFEALVRADERSVEREACAKMVEELNEIGHSYGLENRIRARGNT
jgi:hypothetical protein